MTLTAPSAVPWVEVWRVAAGPVWHVEPEGPAPIHPGPTPAVRLREWRPWPGESLALLVTRPQAIDGRTFTIDSTTLTISPGLRMSDAMLVMVVRASRGGEQAIELPEGALLQSVAIDNQPQPIRQEGNRVVLPVVPGRRTIQVAWRERRGIGILFRAAQVGLGAESVNSTTVFAMPGDRWTLFLGGPRFGPAVLFWPVLAIALLVSVGLGMLRITPLRWWQWFLLSLGLTQVPLWASLIVVAWLLVLGWRRGNPPPDAALFNLLQLILVAWSALALVLLFWAIQHGLLGLPEMQISGNGSSSRTLVWDLDRTGDLLPRPWAVSLPLLAYRLAMLAWSLWLAGAILGWLRWGWECLNAGGLWKAIRRLPPGRVSPTPATPGSPVGPGGSVPAGG